MRRSSSSPVGRPSLLKIVLTLLLHGALADGEPFADRLVRAALGDQLEDLTLARRQRSQQASLFRISQQPGHDLGIEGGAARGDAS